MTPAAADASAVVSADTMLVFEQNDEVISARYRGGAIVDGYLIGLVEAPGRLRFRYVQADTAGNLDAGVSIGLLTRLGDGRLRLVEQFEWITRPGRGENIFEEVRGEDPHD
jgi:hypothetical protein